MAEMVNRQNGIFVGSDLKFALTIDTPGFSMDDDDFEVTILGRSRNKTIKKEEMLLTGDSKWIFTYNTAEIGSGEHWMKVTAYVPDTDFDDGLRTEVVKKLLCNVNP